MFGFVFSEDDSVSSYEQVAAADIERFKKFFHGMLERGIYLAPSAFEVGFISSAHGDEEIAKTLDAARQTMATLA
jgi:glutamate-1-semialdehyde 2,1-aminomutase